MCVQPDGLIMKYWHLDCTDPGYEAAIASAQSYWPGPGLLSVSVKADGYEAIVKIADGTPEPSALIAVFDEPPLHLVAEGWYPE